MVNAPPTPPPTTAVELQDEARSTASTSAQSSSDFVLHPFQTKFPIIADLAMNGDFHRLTQVAEEVDLNVSGELQVKRLLVIAPLVLGYLILDELALARYALARLSEPLASHPLVLGLYQLVMAAKQRLHTKVYSKAQSLLNAFSQDDFFDKNLAVVVGSMLTSFVERYRQRTFALLSKAYVSLPATLASIYLGMTPDEAVAAAQANQWSYDSSTQIFTPLAADKSKSGSPLVSTISTFHFIVDSVGKLEA